MTEQCVGRGAAGRVVPETNVDWQRPGQRGRYPAWFNISMTPDEVSELLGEQGRWHTFDLRDRIPVADNTAYSELDSYVSSIETFDGNGCFRPIGDRWIEIDENQCRLILTRILAFDLAYDAPDIELTKSNQIVDSFVSWFHAMHAFSRMGSLPTRG